MATITLELEQPLTCWLAPEMATATYRSGLTILPVMPICWLSEAHFASHGGRVAPSAPCRSAASSASCWKPEALPMPRPPATMTRASSSLMPAVGSTFLSRVVARDAEGSRAAVTSITWPCRASSLSGRSHGLEPDGGDLGVGAADLHRLGIAAVDRARHQQALGRRGSMSRAMQSMVAPVSRRRASQGARSRPSGVWPRSTMAGAACRTTVSMAWR